MTTALAFSALNTGTFTDNADGGTTFLGGFELIITATPLPSGNAAPTFNDGASTTLTVNENVTATSINDLLDIADTDTGDTLTWSVTSGPSSGSLGGFNASGTSNGGTVTPTGLTYMPDINYAGGDSFTIQISDGTDTNSITVDVTISDVNPVITANSGSIAENAGINDVVLTMATTNDTNGLTWSITGGNTGSAFAINSSTGAVTVNSALDFETTPSYTLTIAVDDEDAGSVADDTESVTIAVTNVGVQTLGSPAVSFADEDLTLENFTVPAGTDRALVVLAGNSASNDILTVSFNGQLLTEIVERTDTTAVDSIWVRAMGSSASSTTGNIVVTRQDGTGTGKQFISAHVYEEVDQATPMGQEQGAQATGSNVGSTLNITSIPGDIVIDLFDTAKTTTPAPTATEGAGQTVVHTQAGTVQTGSSRYSVSTEPGASSVPMSWTSTGVGMLHVAANIKQVSSLPPTTTTVAASGVSDTSAVFNATVNPNGTGTTVVFEYSENATLSSGVMTTPVQDAGSGSVTLPLTYAQGSLSASTTYYFRAKSTNANGTTTGNILSFTTNAPSSGGPITQIGGLGSSSATDDATLENYTLAAGTNRALIVTASHSNETNITGVSFNVQALTQVVERNDGFAVDSIWVRAMGTSSSSTTGNIVVTRAGSSSGTQTILAAAYENVDQLTPMDGAQANDATGANLGSSLTITSETGDLVFDLFDTYKPSAPQPSITDGAGQTQLHPTVGGALASSGVGSWGTSTEPGAPSVTMSWTSDATAIIQVAANINRAPGPSNAAPTFNDGATTTLTVNENSSATSINTLLDIADTDTGDTLTWSVTSGPSNGSLGGFPANGSSNGSNVTPSGLTYTPTSNTSGVDSFTIQISDGTDTDSITVSVTINDIDILGAALQASVSGVQVTYTYTLENLGSVTLSSLSLPNNLDAVFGAGNYSITSAPAVGTDPGTIT
ncbi:MAG: cadherin domain-containing protein [Kiritimatiellae bacterium]|nr:cadherin domain-containing protein [Kiritimatiellia bacterium]